MYENNSLFHYTAKQSPKNEQILIIIILNYRNKEYEIFQNIYDNYLNENIFKNINKI